MAKKHIHILNIILGALFIGFTLFLAWAVLAFAPEENVGVVMIPIAVIAVWVTVYLIQVKYNTFKCVMVTLPIELIIFFLIITQTSSIVT